MTRAKTAKAATHTVDTLFARAVQDHQSGDFPAAKAAYEKVLQRARKHVGALHLLGVLYSQTGHPQKGLSLIEQAIALKPDYAEAHSNLGYILVTLSRYEEAALACRKAIALKPGYADAHSNLGNALNALKRHEEAIACYRSALSFKPNYAEAHYNLGVALLALQRNAEAIEHCQKAIELRPNYLDAYNNLGVAFGAMRRHAEAIVCYRKALALNPNQAGAYCNLAQSLNALNRSDEAIAGYRQALAIDPDFAIAHNNLGNTLRGLNRLDEAIVCYQKAIAIDPDYHSAHWNLALSQLTLGQLRQGLQGHEMRLTQEAPQILATPPYPHWLGDSEGASIAGKIAGKKLLLQFEQGFGDAIQMLRYVPMLEQQGVECWLQLPDQLLALAARSFPKARTFSATDPFPPGLDAWIHLMSLPLAMQTFSETAIRATIPKPPSYLKPDESRSAFWRAQLAETGFVKHVGLVWRGSPVHKNDHNRSLALADLLPLVAAHPSIHFVTLQKGLSAAERSLLAAQRNVRMLDAELSSFDETAAAMSALNLVISVDSAPAHLASALGKPVWILLSFGGEWRWLLNRSDSPWYPSATLFRQSAAGDWAGVVTKITSSLASKTNTIATIPAMQTPETSEALFARALQQHQSGRLLEARELYAQVLKASPQHIGALHLLGVSYSQTGEHEKGVPSIEQAIALKPDFAEAHNNLGIALKVLNRHEEAIACWHKAIALKPDYAEAHSNLGNLLNTLQRHEEAIVSYQRAIALKPDYAEAHSNLGNALLALKRDAEAIDCYRQAIALKPSYVDAHYNLGNALNAAGRSAESLDCYHRAMALKPAYAEAYSNLGNALVTLGRNEEAIAACQQAITLKPDFAEAHSNLGNALNALNRTQEAMICYHKAIALKQDCAEAYYNLGVALKTQKRAAEAVDYYRKAISLKPDFADAYNNLGTALNALNRPEEAMVCFEQAMALKPDFAEVHSNFGNAVNALNRPAEAMDHYQKAIAIKPDCADAQWNLSLALLALGQFEQGFREYETRWARKATTPLPATPYPCWLGDADIAGKKLLIQFEQGQGDAIQMLRYVPLLEEKGAECWIQLPKALLPLMRRSFPQAKMLVLPNLCPAGLDYRTPLMSLPLAMQTFTEAAIPKPSSYLKPDEARVAFWRAQLATQSSSKTVGLVWRGNPEHHNDHNRSAAVSDLLPLVAAHPSIQFVTLQKDLSDSEREALAAHRNLRILDAELSSFDETAAVMCVLDLTISVDSAPAHLVGALGRPVWILLPFCAEWRWLTDRSDSPWYPTAKLFRQQTIGDWTRLINRVDAALSDASASSSTD